jgi:Mg2+ and Co2+ transporter CorA
MLSQDKIKSIIRRLQPHRSRKKTTTPDDNESIYELLDDFEYISNKIEIASRRLENMLPVVTSLVQIMRRLTILALIFVPLGYVSSLFSMDEHNMPGSDHFWV